MTFINKIPWNQSNTSHVNECLKINDEVSRCFQLGFSWIVYFSIEKLETDCLRIDLNFPVVVCKPQNAQDCISGPLFFKILRGSVPPNPSGLLVPVGHSAQCQALGTLNWELAAQNLLENTGKQDTKEF